ncbi:MAG: UvrD-helicase domain-containing protein [Betaproteobacteria bacterium]|nr:UvrD-helicase domain-containing protein [Betaproteobacteria bacterium]MDH3436209.1 UvrD-helicase domain-containing protein [Betaproteobacteria bacterium]
MNAAAESDLDARRSALDPARSFIVQAPAGSGKTELLIQRYLRLLARVDHPEEIVAITFTRKAAGEMRERVLRAFDDARAGKAPASDHEKTTLALAAEALARDSEARWGVTENPVRLRIQTIDSLCSALTRQMPMLSRFGSQPDSIEDASELYLDAARATVELVEGDEAVAQDIERLLAHLDNDAGHIETLLADMLRRRDHWLRHVHGKERAELEAALQNMRRNALERVRERLPAEARVEWTLLADYVLGNLGHGKFTDSIEGWTPLARGFLTGNGDWRQRLTKNEGFPAGKPAQPWKDRALALFQALNSHDSFLAALADMRKLPPEKYSEEQWEVLGAIMRLLPRAAAQLKLVFQARGCVDFTEVAQGALLALGGVEAPSDLALALDYRIRHLLVDEFQDTSISQYELIAKLTAGWDPGDGRTVFAVGDPMQSIYRFREAEVGLFLRARAAGIAGVEVNAISLSANFRSQAGIVEWVNDTFARVMPEREDVAIASVPYTASVATRAALPEAAVSVYPFFNNDRVAEAASVVEIVSQARRENADADIAILVRNRGHLSEIVPQLKDAGLRFRAIEIEPLGHRPVVQDLLALTRALSHPADRLAWLAILRAPWCGLTLADLSALAGGDVKRTVWELMNDGARVAALCADGRARLQRVHAVLQAGLDDRCRGSLRGRTAGVWFALSGPACVEDATDLEDAEIYFDYLESHEEAGEIADPVAFEEGIADLYALPDLQADERLQIMTIHKAKGLQFDTVIVPGLGRAPRGDESRLFLWMEQPSRNGDGAADLLLAPIHETGADDDPIYRWLRTLEAEKERLESGRLLYVAATRARQRLHLLGDARLVVGDDGVPGVKAPGERTLLNQLWPMVEPVYAEAARRVAESSPPPAAEGAAGNDIDQSLRRIASGWQPPSPPARVEWAPPRDRVRARDQIEFSWVGETARHIGSVVHRWLQRIAADGLASWDAARVNALRKTFRDELVVCGLQTGAVEVASERVAATLAQTLADLRGRWVLGAHAHAQSELRLTGAAAGEVVSVVIDRTFVDESGTRWIVDYKTGVHEGADVEAFLDRERERYRPQLERYAMLMRGLGDRPIRLGLYFPLLGGWREWEG